MAMRRGLPFDKVVLPTDDATIYKDECMYCFGSPVRFGFSTATLLVGRVVSFLLHGGGVVQVLVQEKNPTWSRGSGRYRFLPCVVYLRPALLTVFRIVH